MHVLTMHIDSLDDLEQAQLVLQRLRPEFEQREAEREARLKAARIRARHYRAMRGKETLAHGSTV